MEIAKVVRNVSKEEAIESYTTLKGLVCTKDLEHGRAGLKALDYLFFHHRIKAKTKRHLSFYDAMRSPEKIKHLNELIKKYKKVSASDLSPSELLKNQYSVFQLYYGTINQFRPVAAKWLYCQMKPKVGILDFSAGWGGRCMAAMSMGIPYIGIDANTKLESGYTKMIEQYEPTAAVKLFFQPSESFDFSKQKYDLIFTSPPYFKLEEYEKMPDYPTKQLFLDKFFIPVVLSSWKHLLPGGNMALNMPEEMYDAIKSYLPRLKKTLILPLASRHPTAAVLQKALHTNAKPRGEYIYIWHKQRTFTRKQKTKIN